MQRRGTTATSSSHLEQLTHFAAQKSRWEMLVIILSAISAGALARVGASPVLHAGSLVLVIAFVVLARLHLAASVVMLVVGLGISGAVGALIERIPQLAGIAVAVQGIAWWSLRRRRFRPSFTQCFVPLLAATWVMLEWLGIDNPDQRSSG